jgi:hypothetical protein
MKRLRGGMVTTKLGQLLGPSAFVGSVIDETGAAIICVGSEIHRVNAENREVLTAQSRELGMNESSGFALDMARPYSRHE